MTREKPVMNVDDIFLILHHHWVLDTSIVPNERQRLQLALLLLLSAYTATRPGALVYKVTSRPWSEKLLLKLGDEDDGPVVEILLRMIEVEARKRWHANRCLVQGSKNGLFKRRAVDGLVVGASDPDDLVLPTKEGDDGTKTPTAASSSAGIDPEATIILGNMWGLACRSVERSVDFLRKCSGL